MNEESFLDWLFMSLLSLIIWFLGYLSQRHISENVAALERAHKQAIEAGDPQSIAQIERLRQITGDVIHIPVWIAVFFKLKRDNLVNLRSFIIQMIGLGLFLLSTFLAIFEFDHQKRIAYFGLGFMIILVLGVILGLSFRFLRK
ncbi:MAG: hypothetical protein H5T61_14720 [Thermoflexales bacterium]|nr:hypothetical protein [Thermoflexales bacterium]